MVGPFLVGAGILAGKRLREDIATAQAELDALKKAKSTVALAGVCWCILFPCFFIVKDKHGTCNVNTLEEKAREAEDAKDELEHKLQQLERYGQLPEQSQTI